MLYPEFMEYRRRRQGAAAPNGGRGSGRGMDDPHRQQPRDSGASWSRGRPSPPPQRAGSGPGGIVAVILGVEASRTTDCINQVEGAAEAKAAAAQAAVAEAAAAAAVAVAAIFHLLIRRPLNRPPEVHHATHFLPATFPTATRLHLLTAGVSRVGRLHLTSGMRSTAATNL